MWSMFLIALSLIHQQTTLVIGDSEARYINRQVQNYSSIFEKIEVDAEGGTTIQRWGEQGKLKQVLTQHKRPDTIIIFLGTNNHWNKTLPNLVPIFDQIKDIKCIWVGPTAVNAKKWQLNQLLKQEIAKSHCQYIDTEELDIPLEDGWHPTNVGITKWLNYIWSVK